VDLSSELLFLLHSLYSKLSHVPEHHLKEHY
jgi:hypothetical protein